MGAQHSLVTNARMVSMCYTVLKGYSVTDDPSTKPATWAEWRATWRGWAWPMSPEWACEWIVYWSQSWDFLKVIELAGKFTFVVVAVTWYMEAGDREAARRDALKSKQYRAWELINSARGGSGDGGRRAAILDLVGDRVPLYGVDLSNATITDIFIDNPNMNRVKFDGAELVNIEMSHASIQSVNFNSKFFERISFEKSFMMDVTFSPKSPINWVKFEDSRLFNVSFAKQELVNPYFRGSDIGGSDFSGAKLNSAIFKDTKITRTNFAGAVCTYCYFDSVFFDGCDLSDFDLKGNQLPSDTKFCKTKMPGGAMRSENCER